MHFPTNWIKTGSDGEEETIFIITVDGVHCPIEEPTHESFSENKKFFSHKFKMAALDYELGISIFGQKCVWVSGPYAAGTHDISVFRSRLKHEVIRARKESSTGTHYRVLGDRG